MTQKRPQPRQEEKASTNRLFRAMGTEAYVEIVHQKGEAEKATVSLAQAIELCFEKIKIFSRFDPKSELSKLNQQLKTFHDASPDMLSVALHSLSYYKESDGLFDPRILPVLENIGYRSDFSLHKFFTPSPKRLPPRQFSSLKHDLNIWGEMIQFNVPMDFSGIAKGYILDIMAQRLARDGWNDFLVDAGGDMVVSGKNRKGNAWRIDIENVPEGELLLEVSGKGIATSGITRRQWESPDGKRYHHLIHPKHPYSFSFDILSVTVISMSAERADFLAKILFLLGIKKGIASAEKHSIPAIFVEDKKTHAYHVSSKAKKYLVQP